jgi:hypothetical protein
MPPLPVMTNKIDANRGLVLGALKELRVALAGDAENPANARALEQCERLEMAIGQFHAEGIRFAAFTLLHMVQNSRTVFGDAVRTATQGLKDAMDAAGYPH